ncbi:hypothetical protein L6452_40139 [Arctium lappa]|uniref:Uncharacterized protein n=1 Tax=Arctium lappa TaxID=4217 RepID=A0ACB8XLP3_ARCLA|nr:hypothetical protein L6452_40139 [Arctium lappa]
MIEVEPPLKPFVSPTTSFHLRRITKPRNQLGPSLRKNVAIALADLDQILGLNIPPQPKIPVDDPIATPNTNCDHSVATPEPNNPGKSTVREENMQEGVDKETNIHDEGAMNSQPSETQADTPPSQAKHKSPINYSFDAFGMIEKNMSFDDFMTHDEEPDEPQNRMPSLAQTTDFTNNVQENEEGNRNETKDTETVVTQKRTPRTKTRSKRKRKGVDQNQKEADMGEQEENRDNVENQEGETEKNQADPSGGDPKQSKKASRKKQKKAMEDLDRLSKDCSDEKLEVIFKRLTKEGAEWAFDKHTNAIKKSLKKKTKKIVKKVNKLEAEVKLMKKERKQWVEYKEKKEMVMRNSWKKGKQAVDLPPVPTTMLQEENAPTHAE